MKILNVVYDGKMDSGGKISQKLLMKELQEREHEIEFLCTEEYPGFETYLMDDYMNISLLGLRQKLVRNEIEQILKQDDYDYIYSNGYYSTPPAVAAGLRTGTETVSHFRDYWFADVNGTFVGDDGVAYEECNFKNIVKHSAVKRLPWNLYKWRYLKSARSLLDRSDVNVATSGLVKDRLEGCGIGCSGVIPDPFELEKYRDSDGSRFRENHGIDPETKIITFSGTLEKHKGTKLLEQLIPTIDCEDVLFVLTGTGSEKERLEQELADSDVLLTGWLEREDLLDLYDASYLVLYPSVYAEGFGRIPIEAMASRTPVLMSDRIAVREFFEDGEEGYVLDPEEPEAWEERINELLEDPDIQGEMAEKGLEASKMFGVDTHVEEFLEVLNKGRKDI